RLDVQLRDRLADAGALLVVDVDLRINVGLGRLRGARLLCRAWLLRRGAAGLLLSGVAGSVRLLRRRAGRGRLLRLGSIGWRRRIGGLLRCWLSARRGLRCRGRTRRVGRSGRLAGSARRGIGGLAALWLRRIWLRSVLL